MKDNTDKSIYDMLNDIEVDLSEYTREDFNDIEKIKIKKNFKKSIGQKDSSFNYKKYVSVASIAILSLAIVSTTPLGTYASKIISDLVFDIKTVLNIEVDDGNYIKVINQSITKDNLTLRLNEAVLNDNELIISMTNMLKEKIPKDISIEGDMNQKLYINGEFVDSVYTISGVNTSETNIDKILFFNIDTSKYRGVIDIKLELENISIYKQVNNQFHKEKTIEGPFVFEFDFDTTKINKNLKNIKINKGIDFGDNQKITLDKFVYTPLTQKVYYTKNEEAFNNQIDLVLKCVDDLGNEVIFEPRSEVNGIGTLITNSSGKQVDKNAKYLILTAYERSFVNKDNKFEENLKEIEKNIKIDLTSVNK